MTPWYRWRVVVLVLMVATVFAILVVLVRSRGASGQAESGAGGGGARNAKGMAGMDGMAGMEGMAGSTDGSVELTAAQVRQFGVTFGTVERRMLTDEVRAVGTVTADETGITVVTARFGGYIERLHVNVTGQPVRRGQALAEVYSPELLAAQEELLIARRIDVSAGERVLPGALTAGGNMVGSARRRLRLWNVTDAQIDKVLQTGRPRRTLTLYAPASGVITERNVAQGQAIEAGMALFTITDLSRVWVNVQLRAVDAGLVSEGTVAEIEIPGMSGKKFDGRIAYVLPTVNEQMRTLSARVVVSNRDGRLRPGMYASARLVASTRDALTVPRAAVIQTGERALVFVDMGSGSLMPHEVTIGNPSGEYIEVISGVEAGQRVVTSAQFLLESESNVGEAMKRMIGMGGSMQRTGESGTMGEMKGMEMPARAPSAPSPRAPR